MKRIRSVFRKLKACIHPIESNEIFLALNMSIFSGTYFFIQADTLAEEFEDFQASIEVSTSVFSSPFLRCLPLSSYCKYRPPVPKVDR